MNHPIPLLDLAPKRKTPLSLRNPLDYIILFYWAFFFPQALRWYVETFRKVEYKREDRHWRGFLQVLRDDKLQRNLLIQGGFIILIVTLGISLFLQVCGVPINWLGVACGIAIGLGWCTLFSMVGGIEFGTAFGLASGIEGGVALGVGLGILVGITSSSNLTTVFDVILILMMGGLILGFVLGLSGGMSICATNCVTSGVAINLSRGMALSISGSVVGGLAFGITIGILLYPLYLVRGLGIGVMPAVFGLIDGVMFGLAFSFGSWISILGLPDFCIAWLPTFLRNKRAQAPYLLLNRTTSLPLPGLQDWLQASLQNDPAIALQNMNQLLLYSMQFRPVVHTLNHWLNSLPNEQLYKHVDMLANTFYDSEIITFCSISLNATLLKHLVDGLIFLPDGLKKKINQHWNNSLRMDLPFRAACAGYWLMQKKKMAAAIDAFAHTRHIPQGEVLYQTAQALELGRQVKTLEALATWEHKNTWLEESIEAPVRPQTIAVLRYLRSVAREADVAFESISKLNRNVALSHAMVTLTELLNDLGFVCPEIERPIVREIARKWRDILVSEAGRVGKEIAAEPVENPFVAGNPVTGNVFVGREEIFRRIEELWGVSAGQVAPSLVLFGHRRMGKSSILQNLGERRFGVYTIVAQFTMQRAGRLKNTGELLAIFATKMQEALAEKGTLVPEPDFAYFEQSPYIAFDRFLKAVRQNIAGRRLILTIDEFELIEDAIQRGAINAELLAYLRGIIHSEPWFVLALAGLHTLEEMTADYWNPLFSSVTPVRVSFLSWKSTAGLLANPYDDFPLDFTGEAINRVYALVHGQPFLTQLIGHTLVRLYNQSVFEDQTPREPCFQTTDVDEVVERPEFYEQGHYYFQGVWSQAQGLPPGQVTLLQRLAQADGPISRTAWWDGLQLDDPVAEKALKKLLQHDVVLENANGNYDFAVPLMRRWVMKNRE